MPCSASLQLGIRTGSLGSGISEFSQATSYNAHILQVFLFRESTSTCVHGLIHQGRLSYYFRNYFTAKFSKATSDSATCCQKFIY